MLRPEELIRTIYSGDRGCLGFSVDSTAKRVSIFVDCISRIRSSDGLWDFYNEENVEKGSLVFEGVSWFEVTPPGPLPDDYIGDFRIDQVEDGVYTFCFDAGATLPQPPWHHDRNIEIRIRALEFYLVDPRYPEKRIY